MADSSQSDGKKKKKDNDHQKKFRQYFAGLSACLGGFYIGIVIGWAAPAHAMLPDVADSYFWIASIMTPGAACSAIFTAVLMELTGRQFTLIVLSSCTLAIWIVFCLLPAKALLLIALRFCHGFFAGGFCMVSPTFIGEVAHKSTRGCLSVCFQAFLTVGIMYSYCFCLTKNFLVFSIFCTAPTFTGIMFLFVKETPVYLMKKKKEDKAKASLEFYRGKEYDASAELEEIRLVTAKDESSFCKSLKEKACVKALLLLLGMHFIQQMSGINVVMFYAQVIFSASGDKGMACILLIVLGIVQVIATLTAAFIVDRTGRRILWFTSLIIMSAALLGCGVYFQFDHDGYDFTIGILIYIYIIGFSLGAGPLPWALLGELIPTRVKGPVATAVTSFNWLMAFAVTGSFSTLMDTIGPSFLFYGYGGITIAGFVFILFCLVETNGKSLEEIQQELRTGTVKPTVSGR